MSFMVFYIVVIRKTVFYFSGQPQIWNRWIQVITLSHLQISEMACSWDTADAIYLLHILLHGLWDWVDFFSSLIFTEMQTDYKS